MGGFVGVCVYESETELTNIVNMMRDHDLIFVLHFSFLFFFGRYLCIFVCVCVCVGGTR